MKKSKNQTKRVSPLHLGKETLRHLEASDLRPVEGGVITNNECSAKPGTLSCCHHT